MPEVDIIAQLKLKPVSEYSKHIRACFYGEWSAGKTYFAAMAEDIPEMSPVLHLGFEEGLLTVVNRENYHAKEIKTLEQLEAVVDILQKDQASEEPFFKTCIVDNATEIQNLDIQTVMAQAHAANPNQPIDVPSPREWGIIKSRLRRGVHGIRDLPMHTIWTAWKGEKLDKDQNVIEIFPKLAGSIKGEFGGYFDIVGYMTVKNIQSGSKIQVQRNMQVQGTDLVKAKWRNRPESVPMILENPTMQDIYDGWKLSRQVA